MNVNPYEAGRVVVSKQGHDRGRRFLIVELIDEQFALIADGDTRKLDHLKKKKLKHLRTEPQIVTGVLTAIKSRAQTADSAIRKALKDTAPQQAQGSTGADRITDKEEYALVQE